MTSAIGDAPAAASAERQAPTLVREAATTCLAEGAAMYGLALSAMLIRRVGAQPGDWVTVVRALRLLGPAVLPEVESLVETCLHHALAEAPEDQELARLRTEVRAEKRSLEVPYRGTARTTTGDDIVELLFDAIDNAAEVSAEELLDTPPETQDLVVTELGDEGEPRTAVLVAAILQGPSSPALACFLLDHIHAWAHDPIIRDTVQDLGESGRRQLLEPSITEALATVEDARGGLRYRPDEGRVAARPKAEGRSAKQRAAPREAVSADDTTSPRPKRSAKEVFSASAESEQVVYSSWALHRSKLGPVLLFIGLASVGLIVGFAFAGVPLRGPGQQTIALGVSLGGALFFGVLAWVAARAIRVPFRIVRVAGGGVRFEISDGPRSKTLPFPLDYRAAWHKILVYSGRTSREHVVLRIALLDSDGRVALGFEEQLNAFGAPPRGWIEEEIAIPHELVYSALFKNLHLGELARQLAHWNREVGAPTGRD